MKCKRLNVAVVGIGGFAKAHHTALHALEQAGRVKVVATCDPLWKELDQACVEFAFTERGVRVYPNFESLLQAHQGGLDFVSVASPIPYHADHHRACVERGIACYLEKPPTLDPRVLTQMLDVEARARFETQVGFNHTGQRWRQQLKARVLDGEFGRLRRVAFKGLWRRSEAYFERNSWAGRLMLGDCILLDSCCGNAMAHHLHNLLFHAGTNEVMSWAQPKIVEAELYRANRIEGPDTVFARGVLDNGVEFLLASTHACHAFYEHVEVIECEHARIEIPEEGRGVVIHSDGRRESFDTGDGSAWVLIKQNLESYCDYLTGQNARPATRLVDARSFVHLNALLYIAGGKIHPVRSPHALQLRMPDEPRDTFCIPQIREVCDAFLRNGRLPSEARLPWGVSGGSVHGGQMHLDGLRPVLKTLCRASGIGSTQVHTPLAAPLPTSA